ncbi:MAG: hypothetical protein QFF03_05465 [Pseudomonadota bacterium]|nr:hypothetical protein [Pseudomonadota bacterium]
MTHPPAFDASIPVLTEVFPDQPGAPSDDGAPAALEARAIDGWSEPEWALLERQLAERILQQLQGRVDFVLEQRLRDSMEEALRHAMAGLTDEIRRGLQQTIEKIVVRAVAQELTHLQSLKK